MPDDLLSLLALNALPKIGPIRIRRLLDHFGSPGAILRQSENALQQVNGVGPEVAAILANWHKHADPEAELALCERHGFSLLTAKSPHWPRNLTHSPDAPLLLYVRGEILPDDQSSLAIVGSRRSTHYGRSATRRFASALAHAGYTIISGLARGIDTEAHEAALEAGGRTIAVLGSGLLRLYPSENAGLADRIADGQGAVVSEFPLLCPPDKQTFPQRNRIVATWCSGLLVAECPKRSGSLITANIATEAGRPIFAIPGPIDQPNSEGCHDLIREGATLVTHPQHILDEFQGQPLLDFGESRATQPQTAPVVSPPRPRLSDIEEKIHQSLGARECTMDQLADLTSLPIHLVSATLLGLEMKGVVRQLAGQRYTLTLKV